MNKFSCSKLSTKDLLSVKAWARGYGIRVNEAFVGPALGRGGSQFYDKDIKSINKESVYNVTHTTDSMSPSYLVKLF